MGARNKHAVQSAIDEPSELSIGLLVANRAVCRCWQKLEGGRTMVGYNVEHESTLQLVVIC